MDSPNIPCNSSHQQPAKSESVYLTRSVTFGMHLYRTPGEDASVYFVDEQRGIRKMLIDSLGNIQNFPGMIKEDFWVREVAPNYLKPQIRFRSSFQERDGGWIFLWQVQPDGQYWADDGGFGGDNDSEVFLYTFVNMDGDFTQPFRIYQLCNRGYSLERFRLCHDRAMDDFLQALTDEAQHSSCPSCLFPQLYGVYTHYYSDCFYQLRNKAEALAYWDDPVLRRDLKRLAQELLDTFKPLWDIAGRDGSKIKGCMTLFYLLTEAPVFQKVLEKFFDGNMDVYTKSHL